MSRSSAERGVGGAPSCHGNQLPSSGDRGEGPVLASLSPDHSPASVEEIKEALKGKGCSHEKALYTSLILLSEILKFRGEKFRGT